MDQNRPNGPNGPNWPKCYIDVHQNEYSINKCYTLVFRYFTNIDL